MRCSVRSILLGVVLLIGCEEATAVDVCTIFNSPKRYVGITDPGNPNYDPLCTDNDVNSAIAAIAAGSNTCPATIYITHEHDADHIAQHIVFDNTNRSITLIGVDHGIACGSGNLQICGDPPCSAPTTPLLTLDAYNTSGSVIHLNGQNEVALNWLTIQHGAADYNANGGGIYFSGTGTLSLATTVVQSNYAGYGGGIYFNGSGGNATLTLDVNTLIVGNEAQFSGGGIRIDGTARLFALQDQTILFNNKADGYDPVANQTVEGYGGGLEIVGPARADIGSSGYNGLGVIYDNKALYGAGVTVFASSNGDIGTARLFTTNPDFAVRIQNNTAANSGGGIFLRPNFNGGSGSAVLCAQNFRIDGNIAQEGVAVYSDDDSHLGDHDGAYVAFNIDPEKSCASPETVASLGAVVCAREVACNSIDGNVAENSASQPTQGSTIFSQSVGMAAVDRVSMRNNQGAHLIHMIEPLLASMSDCLLVNNQLSAQALLGENSDGVTEVQFLNCTVSHNTIASGAVIRTDSPLRLSNDIFDQFGIATLDYVGSSTGLAASFLLSNDISAFSPKVDIIQGTPSFVNLAGGDYHLQANSTGVDFSPATGGIDLDGLPRDIDLTSVANVYGPRDLGAYERQNVFYNCGAADSIFCTGFEHQ